MSRMNRPRLITFGSKRLSARERQQLRGKLRASPDAIQRVLDTALCRRVARHLALQELQIATDYVQQIVEIVRNAASQITDRFHLLALPQRLFRLHELGGAQLYTRFQGLVEICQSSGRIAGSFLAVT